MKQVTYIDPAQGWMYGFPKPVPEDWLSMTIEQKDSWFKEQGYPIEKFEGCSVRYFVREEEDNE